MNENEYQAKLIKRLERVFEGCLILKNDSGHRQGIPDITIYYGRYWAMLEIKTSEEANVQPNQKYYVETLREMGFAAFIYPEIEEEILRELQQAFSPSGIAR